MKINYNILNNTNQLLVQNFIQYNSCYILQELRSKSFPKFYRMLFDQIRPKKYQIIKVYNCSEEPTILEPIDIKLLYKSTELEIIDLKFGNISKESKESKKIHSDYNFKDFLIKMTHFYEV